MKVRSSVCGIVFVLSNVFVAAAQETPAPEAPPPVGEYVIGVEDQVGVAVWNEADLTRSQTVRPDGKITVALLGDIQAAGRTPRELDDQITEALRKWINDPEVTVVVEAINSFKVYMIGEFAGQGELVLKRRTKLLEAIAMKGGLTAFADKSNIQVVREENGRETRLRIDYKKILSGDRPDLNIYLRPGDIIIAN